MGSPVVSEPAPGVRGTRTADRGQATVEFALCLPLMVLVVLFVLQLLVVGLAKVQLVNAARDCARAAAVSAEPSSAVARSINRLGLDDVDYSVNTADGWVTVTLTRTVTTDISLVGSLVDDVVLSESVTMLVEPPLG